jgi:hypothetical protein
MSSCWVVRSQPQVPWGNEYHYDTIWMTVDAVDAKLWDPDLDVFINHENHCVSHLYIYICKYIYIYT